MKNSARKNSRHPPRRMSVKAAAIVPSAGLGKRFGPERNKPFFPLLGKPLIAWAVGALEEVDEIIEIIPVVNEPLMEEAIAVFDRFGMKKVRQVAPGGPERHDSVRNGLEFLGEDVPLVLIHDCARPLIETSIIKSAIYALSDNPALDGVVVGVPVKDTIKTVDASLTVTGTPGRNALWAAQTPQVFRTEALISAYEKAALDGFHSTDDSAVMEYAGGKVSMLMGSYKNIKITGPEDIALAEAFLKEAG